MLAQTLLPIAALAAFVTQGAAAPATTEHELVARQGYIANCTATYTVQSGDACFVIRDLYNDTFSLADFYAWNPQVDPNCSNLWVGEVVCVGVSNSTGPPPACPVPVKPGLVSNCHSCYKVVEGDACVTIINSNHITLAQFHTWNPDLNAACTNLEIGYNYCVGVSAA